METAILVPWLIIESTGPSRKVSDTFKAHIGFDLMKKNPFTFFQVTINNPDVPENNM